MKKLNWGIIGSGVIANEMAQALLDVNGEIYAVGHRDMNKAIDFAMKYKIKNAYGVLQYKQHQHQDHLIIPQHFHKHF